MSDDDDFIYNPNRADYCPCDYHHYVHHFDHVSRGYHVDRCPYCAANSAIDLDDVAAEHRRAANDGAA